MHIEKRKFRKGFHISWNKKQRSPQKEIPDQTLVSSSKKEGFEVKSTQRKIAEAKPDVTQNEVSLIKPLSNKTTSSNNTMLKGQEKKEISSVKSLSAQKEKRTKKNEGSNHSGYLYLLAALGIPILAINKKRNYDLSSWASENQQKARWIIGAGTATAFLSSYFVGRLWHFDIPEHSLPIALVLGGTGGATYLLSRSNRGRITGGMMLNLAANFGSFTLGTMRPTLESESPYIMHPALMVFLTLALILLLIGSSYLIAALSCTIACNGYGFAAAAVLIGGLYLVAFLFMLAILNVYRKKGDEERSFAKTAALTALIVIAALALLVLVLAFI